MGEQNPETDEAPEQRIENGVVTSADAGTVAAVDVDEAIEEAEAEDDAGGAS